MAQLKGIPGYLNDSAGKGKPAVIVVHEWWGLNAQIRGVADRFAKEGFIAFAADLYHGQLATDDATAGKLMQSMDWKVAEQDLRAAVSELKAREPNEKIGITGFCMGGAVSLFAAARIPEIAACVPFYGIPPDPQALKGIKAKVQGHFANIDNWCSPDRVDALEQLLKSSGVSVEIHRYDAQHAFFNEERKQVHSPENARKAWERTIAFLRNNLA
jgi:carboxymethylenebutenolidase